MAGRRPEFIQVKVALNQLRCVPLALSLMSNLKIKLGVSERGAFFSSKINRFNQFGWLSCNQKLQKEKSLYVICIERNTEQDVYTIHLYYLFRVSWSANKGARARPIKPRLPMN
jgi:hypothetical protein